jgi:hypothetical protein
VTRPFFGVNIIARIFAGAVVLAFVDRRERRPATRRRLHQPSG